VYVRFVQAPDRSDFQEVIDTLPTLADIGIVLFIVWLSRTNVDVSAIIPLANGESMVMEPFEDWTEQRVIGHSEPDCASSKLHTKLNSLLALGSDLSVLGIEFPVLSNP
jgi:hypothetical protein